MKLICLATKLVSLPQSKCLQRARKCFCSFQRELIGILLISIQVGVAKDNELETDRIFYLFRCLSRLPFAVGMHPAHFDLVKARQEEGGHWLVLHLGELVALAYQVGEVHFQGSFKLYMIYMS